MRFLADPFGLWRDGRLHVFAEAYDYRTRHGVIDWLALTPEGGVTSRETVLAEPWHLSYPVVMEAEDETWMLPEAWRSGTSWLYRAVDFPRRWERAHVLALDVVPVDATPFLHEGRWWLFYSPAGIDALHAAFADRILGPWRPHPLNPLRTGTDGSRPGGTPAIVEGGLVLPVQDGSRTYGGAVRPLAIDRLTPDRFEARLGPPIAAPAALAPYVDGLHTLAGVGDVTLIDSKRVVLNARSLGVLATRLFRGRASVRR
jgi:hypothetical protein